MANSKCSGTAPMALRQTESGWPHGRQECSECHGFYFVTKAGVLAKHVPHKGDNQYEARHRRILESQHSGNVNPPVHNHGTEEGAGLACNERIFNGFRRGACLPDLEPTDSSNGVTL